MRIGRVIAFAGLAAVLLVSGCSVVSCTSERIKYNEAAVEVVEIGSNAGVQEAEIPTGTRYWAPPFSYRYIVKFPTTLQTYPEKGKKDCYNFINKDSVSTTVCTSKNILINPGDADNIVRKYRGSISRGGGSDGYVLDDIVSGPIHREQQQAFIQHGAEFTSAELYADGGQKLLAKVKNDLVPRFQKDGINIVDLMPASPPQLPEDIVDSIKGALKAQTEARRKDAELAATVAEGKKTIAQATAEAEARRLAAESIRANPEIVVLEEIRARGRSLCPVNAKTCIIGASAMAGVGE